MNCETFGKQFAAWLETTWDVENPGDGEMPSRLVQHTESCASCAAKLRRASEIVGLSRTETEQSPFLATRITAKIALQAGGHAANVKSGLRRFVMRAALPAAALLIVALSALLFFPDKGQTGNTVLIKFSLAVPGAEQVHVVGDWNGWDPAANPLQDGDGDGVWETEIELVPGEEYRYQFFIDDKTWMADPTAPLRIDDGFGGTNSVLSI